MKKRVLVWGDSPYAPTGFGTVTRNICAQLHTSGKCDVSVVAIGEGVDEAGNLFTLASPGGGKEFPYKVHPQTDNSQFNGTLLEHLILTDNYDILLVVCDVWMHIHINGLIDYARYKRGKTIKTIFYTPVDSASFIRDAVAHWDKADYPVTFTKFGRRVAIEANPALAGKLQVIYHGCEPNVFYPLPPRLRRQARTNLRQSTDSTFLVLNVNRNQPRKDLGRTMAIFREFHKTHPKSRLYIHAKDEDMGGSLSRIAAFVGLHELILPENPWLPREQMNLVYNAADVCVSTTLGEGWGLSVTEAMAAGIPVIFPRNTSLSEIIGENEERGYLCDSGVGDDAYTIAYGQDSCPRPITSQRSMLEKLEQVYADRVGPGEYKGKTREKIEAARVWSMQHSWRQIGQQWLDLLGLVKEGRS